MQMDKKGLNEMDYPIPAGTTGNMTLTHLYILNNQIYRKEHRVQILNKKSQDPDIIIEKYKHKFHPVKKKPLWFPSRQRIHRRRRN